ncbi:MAG: hypothetical protein FH748_05460 [Balneolaceae bacterium]|nr:hypothetical protein [Balneolaceae bacterium]
MGFRPAETLEKFKPGGYSNLVQYANKQIFDAYYRFREIHTDHKALVQLLELPPQRADEQTKKALPPRSENYRNLIVDTQTGEVLYSDTHSMFIVARRGEQVIAADYDENEQKYLLEIYTYDR